MNLFEAIEQWLETTFIAPIKERLTRMDKDIETLAARVLETQTPLVMVQPPAGDLSFLAQRLHELTQRVESDAWRTRGTLVEILRRLNEIEEQAQTEGQVEDIVGHALDNDEFRDRISEFIRTSIENDECTRDAVRELAKEFLDDELDDLEVEIQRG